MFDLSLAEILLVVVVGVVFIGPKDLPVIVRAVAKGIKTLRGFTHEIKQAFDEVSRDTGLKDSIDSIEGEMRLIKGDDGKLYESYEMPKAVKNNEQ